MWKKRYLRGRTDIGTMSWTVCTTRLPEWCGIMAMMACGMPAETILHRNKQ